MNNESKHEVELNLAPIIDCFTVLITYLLLSASFISLGILSVTVAASEDSSKITNLPEVLLTLELTASRDFLIVSERPGQEPNSLRISNINQSWDFKGLNSQLEMLKTQFPALNALVVGSDDSLSYDELVKAINHSRKYFSNIAIRTENESKSQLSP